MFADVSHETLGLFCGLATALCWAIAVVLFKKSGDQLGPLALNMFKNLVALVLMGATFLVVGFHPGEATQSELLLLFASGAVGIGIADTLLFYALNRIGAARQAIVDTLYSPTVVALSFFMLHEVMGLRDAVGGLLILGAVVLATFPFGPRVPGSSQPLGRGILAGALSMLLMACAIVAVKPILERNDVLFCTTVRLLGGTTTLALFGLSSRKGRAELVQVFVPSPALRYALPGAIMGTYFSLLLWIGAFKYAPAGIAALLNQTSTIFIVLLAAVFLREPLTARVIAAVLCATAGSLLVLL